MARSKCRDFISRASERPQTCRFFRGVRWLPMPSPKKMEHARTRGGGGEKDREVPCSPMFGRCCVRWALLLNIQRATTPSILGVRGSSLDSRQLSPLPFHNIPYPAQTPKTEKKINVVHPKRTVPKWGGDFFFRRLVVVRVVPECGRPHDASRLPRRAADAAVRSTDEGAAGGRKKNIARPTPERSHVLAAVA